MPWYHAVVESKHDLQNPTTAEKIRLLGERMNLGPDSVVLDVASGRGGPAIILAQTFGCRLKCIEKAEEFDRAARERAAEAGVESLIEFVRADARESSFESGRYDAALCLGASFIWDGLPATLEALVPAARPGGFVAVGEPYWRTWPVPDHATLEEGEKYLSLYDTVKVFESAALSPITLIDASLDDWDRYETLHWLAADEWLNEHAEDPDAQRIRENIERDRERYLRWERELLGWAIFVTRKI